MAADASFEIPIGFTKDGKHFAFEEFGTQDGSGYSYSTIFAVDLERDLWVAGSPFKAMIEDEAVGLKVARDRSVKSAGFLLRKFGFDRPARLLMARGLGEVARPGERSEVVWPDTGFPGEERGRFGLTLDLVDFSETPNCSDGARGFRLTLHTDGGDRVLHEDTAISSSRGCPTGYAVSRVYIPDGIWQPPYAAVLISVFRRGFEGTDRRFIALPVPLGGIAN
jgi:predicted secreted protein